MRLRGIVDRWGDWAVAAALAVEFEYWVWVSSDVLPAGGRPVWTVLGALMTVPLAWRQRAPGTVLLIVTGTFFVAWLLAGGGGSSGPLAVSLAPLVAFYSAGAHCDERRSLPAAGGGFALVVVAMVITAARGEGGPRVAAWLAFAVAWLVGGGLRRRRGELLLLHDRTTSLEREREEKARAAVAEERGRIARELHDIVAHSVSVMVVQAQAGPRLVGDPGKASQAFRSIEGAGREALIELRRLLGILRTEENELLTGPQPGLDSLDSLLEQVRQAGLHVELHVEGEPTVLPPGVDLCAYRILQEALTNTLKHAEGANAEIVVRYALASLELRVTDNGPGPPASANGTGHGLIGMRERVALYSGKLETGANNSGGFRVRALLPLDQGTQR